MKMLRFRPQMTHYLKSNKTFSSGFVGLASCPPSAGDFLTIGYYESMNLHFLLILWRCHSCEGRNQFSESECHAEGVILSAPVYRNFSKP